MSLLNKYRVSLTHIIIAVLILLLSFFIYRWVNDARRIKTERMAAAIDTIIIYKTLAGKTAYKVYEKSVVDKTLTDSLAQEYKIRTKELERYLSIIASSDFSGIKSIAHDTIYIDKQGEKKAGKYGEYKDGYIDLAATITDSMRFSRLKVTDTLSAVFQKTTIRGEVFNKLIVSSKSPYSTIVGLEDIKLRQEPQYRRWGLGVSFGWDPLRMQPYAGIGINYNVFRFKK